MTFTLNSGEFDLGGGYIGRGTIIAGETYNVGAATTGVQGLLNTSGLTGISYTAGENIGEVHFRTSDDPSLIGGLSQGITFAWIDAGNFTPNNVTNNARFHVSVNTSASGGSYNGYANYLNSSTSNSEVLIVPSSPYSVGNGSPYRDAFTNSSNWRFLVRDHATSLIHYPTTTETGSVFAASCVNSGTPGSEQWGFWCAGEVGAREGYFNQTQGYFAIVFLKNGASTYFSAFTPQSENSTARNDAPAKAYNIIPGAGQTTTNDRMSDLYIFKNLTGFKSYPIGKVPGCFYIDPNKEGFDNYLIGEAIDINPDVNAVFEGRDRALIVARWGEDSTITISNTGSLFTVTSASPNRRTLENARRLRITNIAPGGMAINTSYWVINWSEQVAGSEAGTYTFNLATVEGGSAIAPSTNETGMSVTLKAPLIAMRCY